MAVPAVPLLLALGGLGGVAPLTDWNHPVSDVDVLGPLTDGWNPNIVLTVGLMAAVPVHAHPMSHCPAGNVRPAVVLSWNPATAVRSMVP